MARNNSFFHEQRRQCKEQGYARRIIIVKKVFLEGSTVVPKSLSMRICFQMLLSLLADRNHFTLAPVYSLLWAYLKANRASLYTAALNDA